MAVTKKQLANLKPPVKGEVRNPKGRGKGTPNFKTILKRWMFQTETVQNPYTKTKEELSQLDVMVLAQVAKARKGDTTAFNALLDRLEGRAKQSIDIDHTTDGESLQPQKTTDLSKLTDAELRTLAKLQRKSRVGET
jgi:hypothetical protein